MKIAEEYYNNSGECINLPNSDCGCCDTIREFYKKAEEWYNNIMKKLAPDEEEQEVIYAALKVSIRLENLGNILVTKGSGIDSIIGYGKNVLVNLPVGSVINIKATPIKGYDFDYWLVNGAKETGDTLEHTIKEGTNIIVANFKRSDVDTNEYFWFGAATDYNNIFNNSSYKYLINNTVNVPSVTAQDGDYFWIICNENWEFEDFASNGYSTTKFNLFETINGNKIYKSTKDLGNYTHNNIIINFNLI